MRNEKTTRKEKMVNLKSVNCVIDEETLITYPVNKNGKPRKQLSPEAL